MSTDSNDKLEDAPRTIIRRLLHTVAEVALSFVFAGGLFFASFDLMCRFSGVCTDTGGIAVFVVSFLLVSIVWGILMTTFARYRTRLVARKRLDIAIAVITVGLWVYCFFAFD